MEEEEKKEKEEYNPIKHGITEGSKVVSEFLKSKYSHDKTGLYVHLAVVGFILTGIIILTKICKLESSIIGTLLGSLIGFSFGNFPKNGKGNSSN
jgi:hypothetical protein